MTSNAAVTTDEVMKLGKPRGVKRSVFYTKFVTQFRHTHDNDHKHDCFPDMMFGWAGHNFNYGIVGRCTKGCCSTVQQQPPNVAIAVVGLQSQFWKRTVSWTVVH
jgi:hypothetical protein